MDIVNVYSGRRVFLFHAKWNGCDSPELFSDIMEPKKILYDLEKNEICFVKIEKKSNLWKFSKKIRRLFSCSQSDLERQSSTSQEPRIGNLPS